MKELEQSEIATLRTYRGNFDAIIRELGEVSVLERDLKNRKQVAESALDENCKGQQDLLNSLEQKYGQGQLDLDRGLFIPNTVPEPVQTVEDKVESKPKTKTTTRKKS